MLGLWSSVRSGGEEVMVGLLGLWSGVRSSGEEVMVAC